MSDPLRYLKIDKVKIADASTLQEWAARKMVWAPDPVEGFVAASLQSEKGDKSIVVREDTRAEMEVNTADVQKANPPKYTKVEDMSELSYLNEGSVLWNMKDRYAADLIYTYSGLFCVVVNPYKNIPIYGDEVIDAYRGRKRAQMPPHVFAVTDQAYRDMLQDREDQSILCTGESGAGKTENTKKCIKYLATVASGGTFRKASRKSQADMSRRRRSSIGMTGIVKDDAGMERGELENQLLQANPILETFGNACTVKNDNSSRFGKFIKIMFDGSGFIVGASIDTYLLEKSRAVRQNDGERSFHCFYQLLKGAPADWAKDLLLGSFKEYNYLSNGEIQLQGVQDAMEFNATNEAFKIMGMAEEEIKSVWQVVSAVLQFGQVPVDEGRRGEQAEIKDDTALQKLASLLGINVVELQKSLLKPKVKAGSEFVAKQQTKQQVDFALESLAKAQYERLFLWLVRRINLALDRTRRGGKSFIGLLDIAGFEIFKINSFEQLLINLTNERLQQLFNSRMFKLEMEEYNKEGIDASSIADFALDLEPTIQLLQGPQGVLSLIDEQSLFPRTTDKTLVAKLQEQLSSHEKFKPGGFKSIGDFQIVHYAGTVAYDATNWLAKNKDPVNDNVTALLENSSNNFVKDLWSDIFSGYVASTGTRRGAMRTVSKLYKEALGSLMETLQATTPNFIRCIIPNHEKKAGKINAPLVLDQLRCNGVLEGIRIVRQGWPSRILYSEFKLRYQILARGAMPSGFIDGRKAAEVILDALELDKSSYQFGSTKLFFRAGVLARLEEERDLKLSKLILGLQAHCRGYLARRGHQYLLHGSQAITVVQRNVRAYLKLRSWPWWSLFTKVKPLLKVSRGDEEMRLLREEVEKWKLKAETEEKGRLEAEEKLERALDERMALADQLESERAALAELQEIRQRLAVKNQQLESELAEIEGQLDEQIETSEKLLGEKKGFLAEIEGLKSDLQMGLAETARAERLEQQITEWKTKYEEEQKITEEMELAKSKANSELTQLRNEVDDLTAKAAKAEKALAKVKAELADANLENDRQREAVAEANKAQRKFDLSIKEREMAQETLQSQLDAALAENRSLNSKLLVVREELAQATDDLSAAESAKRRAQQELEEILETKDDAHKSAHDMEQANKKLQLRVKELEEELVQVEDENILLEKSRSQLQVQLNAANTKLETAMAEENDAASVESRRRLQQQLSQLEREIDEERKARAKASNEAKKAKLDLEGSQATLDEFAAQVASLTRALKNSERANSLLRAAAEGGEGGDGSRVSDMKKRLKELKREVETLEDEVTRLKTSERRAVRDKQEADDLVQTLEEEVRTLRTKLRKLRIQSSEAAALTQDYDVHKSGKTADGADVEYTAHYRKVTKKTEEVVSDEEV